MVLVTGGKCHDGACRAEASQPVRNDELVGTTVGTVDNDSDDETRTEALGSLSRIEKRSRDYVRSSYTETTKSRDVLRKRGHGVRMLYKLR